MILNVYFKFTKEFNIWDSAKNFLHFLHRIFYPEVKFDPLLETNPFYFCWEFICYGSHRQVIRGCPNFPRYPLNICMHTHPLNSLSQFLINSLFACVIQFNYYLCMIVLFPTIFTRDACIQSTNQTFIHF